MDDRSCQTPIAIIGMGCMFPKARDLAGYWANILNRVDAITDVPPTHWKPEDYFDADPKSPDRTYAARGGFLSPVDFPPLEFGIAPNTLEAIDTTQLLGLMVAREALEDAGYGPGREFNRDRVSVILGVTGTLELVIPLGARLGHPIWRRALKEAGVEEAVANRVVQRIGDSYVGWQEDSFPGLLGNVVAGRIANRLDLGGTNCVVDAACASSLSALHLAMLELASGRCDMALTGGLDTFNDIFMYMCFSKTPALSPTGDAKPFDAKADGTILGEGLGVLVLKRLESAERDGDKIYAIIKGIGSSSDGKGNAIYSPSSAGQAKALRQAYRLANIAPNTVGLVEAHGTGTRAGDAAELTALGQVFRESQADGVGEPWCAVGSVKSQIGHTKAAAGAAGLIKTALALHHKVLPPTIKVNQPIDFGIPSLLYVNTEKRPWLPRRDHSRRAAVSSFGFGGSNFHCVLEEYRPEKTDVDWDGKVQIFAWSADTREKLAEALTDFAASLSNESWEHLRSSACRLRDTFQAGKAARLLMVIEKDRTDVGRLVANGQSMLLGHPTKNSWSTPNGLFFGAGPAPGKLAFIFPGQGSQYVGMFRDLACQFPQMQQALADVNAAWEKKQLSDFIYPKPEFSEAGRARNEEALRNTAVAQPALGAVSRGALLVLEHFGVQPEAVAGHSYGELVALHAAGRIDVPTLCSLSMLRGRLMDAAANGADPGAMLAVRASLDRVREILAGENLDVVIANKNAPEQFVLSGASAEIERARMIFQQKKVDCKPLPVSAAFHSRFVAGVRRPLLAALSENPWRSSHIPVFANTTGEEYPADPSQAQELLAGQLAQPVEFLAIIENMYRFGVRTFVEVGPGSKLTGLIGATLRDRAHQASAIDASAGKQSGSFDLARLLASLAAQGHRVHLSQWDPGIKKPPFKKPTLTIPICGTNYVKPKSKQAALKSGVAGKSERNVAMTEELDKSMARSHAKVGGQRNEAMAVETEQSEEVERQNCVPALNRSVEQAPPTEPPSSPCVESVARNALSTEAFMATQENLLALQRLAEQTAQVHRQFLEGQDKTLQVFQTLLRQQQALFSPGRDVLSEAESGNEVVGEKALSTDLVASLPIVIEPPVPSKPSLPAAASAPEKAVKLEPNHALPLQPQKNESNPFQVVLVNVIAEKTGYPAEMLELDMELDSDLGIDSIKRVEIFSALQERLPQAPPVKSEHLGALRTLRQVVDFLISSPGIPKPDETGQYGLADTPRNGSEIISVQPSLIPSEAVLLEVVAEKTGYPAEMLELDMELDADLGIDSIKRVEIFSALQERLPHAPVVKSEHLGTLRTLRQVVDFLSQTASGERCSHRAILGESGSAGASPSQVSSGSESKPLLASATASQLAVAESPPRMTNGFHSAEQSSHPSSQPTLRRYALTAQPLTPEAEEKPWSLAAGGEFWITDEGGGLAKRVADFLEQRGFRPRLVDLQDYPRISPFLPLVGLIILAPAHELADRFIQDAFGLLKTAMLGLRQAGKAGGAVIVTVSRMDGAFGLNNPQNAVSGGLAGLVKTAAKEWPEVCCKALDLSADWPDLDTAAKAVVETLLQQGPMEIGLSHQGAVTLQLSEKPLAISGKVVANGAVPPARGDVIVVSGGARGVTAEASVTLARTFAPTLVLLGRSPKPQSEPDWLAPLTEESEIKNALLAHAQGPISPRELGDQYRRVGANREIGRNLQRIQEAGGQVHYHSLDIRDESSVKAALAEVRSRLGPIRGLVHGAGILEDRLIEDKTPEQFQHVYSTKVAGLRALLGSLESDDLKLLILFSSVTARFGRAGQVDYAAANEVLNKLAQQEARLRPHCRVLSLNWGPWDGGMVTPALKKIFDREGVGLIPLEAGADFLVREIGQNSDRAVEVVVLADQDRGSRIEDRGSRIEDGGSRIEDGGWRIEDRGSSIAASASTIADPESSTLDPQEFNRRPKDRMTVAFERTLDVEQFPFLKSHVIDSKAVLPLAMSMEWLAHAALHSNPGLTFHGFDEVRVLHGVILEEEISCTVRALAGKPLPEDSFMRVPVELRSSKEIDRMCSAEGETQHVRGEVILVARLPQSDQRVPKIPLKPYGRNIDEVYAQLLFHGSHLQGIDRIEGWSERGIVGFVNGAPAPSDWIGNPLRNTWLLDPLVIDSAFQLMVLWAFANKGCASLPCFVGRYRQYQRTLPRGGIRVVAEVKESSDHRAVADIFFVDSTGNVVARMENYESVIDAGLNQAFRRNQLGQPSFVSHG